MTGARDDLLAHLATGTTTVCHAWALKRRDGVSLGFTDHDRDLVFDGIRFAAESGLTARVLEQVTGMAPDNSEAMGALTDDAIRDEDVAAGRYDDAEVLVWLVNWADPEQRMLEFRGRTGEIVRMGREFRVELRGLTYELNRTVGRVIQAGCDAVLGDARCRFDLSTPGYRVEARITRVDGGARLVISGTETFPDRWFERGRLTVLDGAGSGQAAKVRADRSAAGSREVELWTALGVIPAEGDRVDLVAGCDGRAETCKAKFNNFMNFRGFPHVPGEDWLTSYPTSSGANGGRRRK